ncbi:amidohydrolase [Celerinatantimonas sp. YJH-8]|uniref:amidohydrolase n=1 Tax=Celerinatantimonas sp. YJH-8 TaxID=3228714 RepID=UPI0038C7A772
MNQSLKLELTNIRHQIHHHAELSGCEKNTILLLTEKLNKLRHPPQLFPLDQNGLLARFSGSHEGPNILLRADIDALPIQESSEKSYASVTAGVAHLCGHDGHCSSLLGCAIQLSETPLVRGQVDLLFQPAEETGQGGPMMVRALKQLGVQYDAAFAYHNLPGYPLGQVVLRHQHFTAAVQSIAIQFKGRIAHAAEPEQGICPAYAIAQLLQLAERWSLNQPEKADFQLITPICVHMGETAYGTMPGDGEVHFTLRCWGNERMDLLAKKFQQQIEQIAHDQQLAVHYDWLDIFRSCENHTEAVDVLEQICHQFGQEVYHRPQPFKWGEDFGCFTEHFNGAMFGLGSGEQQPPLHHIDFDYPDELLVPAAKMFEHIARHYCG